MSDGKRQYLVVVRGVRILVEASSRDEAPREAIEQLIELGIVKQRPTQHPDGSYVGVCVEEGF